MSGGMVPRLGVMLCGCGWDVAVFGGGCGVDGVILLFCKDIERCYQFVVVHIA